MTIRVSCQTCGQQFGAPENLAGQSVACPGCRGTINIPTIDPLQAADPLGQPSASNLARPATPAPRPAAGKAPRPAAGQNKVWLIAAAAGGGGGLLLIVLLAVFLMRSDSGEPGETTVDVSPNRTSLQPGSTANDRSETNDRSKTSNRAEPGPPDSTKQPATPPIEPDAAPDEPPSATLAWSVTADPLPEKWRIPPGDEITIPLDFSRQSETLFPSTPSPFVALGSNQRDDDVRQLWDLARGSCVGTIKGKAGLVAPIALSPNGRWLAGTPLEKSAQKGRWVAVWSFESGTVEKTIRIHEGADLRGMDFTGNDELITAHRDPANSKQMIVKVWDLASEQSQRSFVTTVVNVWASEVALSAGRRYMAVIPTALDDKRVKIYDLTTARQAGEIVLPEHLSCKGCSFSPDGKEFAGLFDWASKPSFFCWSLADGSLVAEKRPENAWGSLAGGALSTDAPLQWLDDGIGWFVSGRVALDRNELKAIWEFPGPARFGVANRLISGGRILSVGQAGRTKVLQTTMLPQSQLVASLAAMETGGDPIDAYLPPLTPAGQLAADTVTVTEDDVPWAVTPDPVVQAGPYGQRPIDLGEETIESIMFSLRPTGQAVLLRGYQRRPSEIPDPATTRFYLERYDLSAGEKRGRFEVPGGSELLDVSPEARLGLTVIGKERARLDVWSMADGKHLLGWRPYQHEDATVKGKSSTALVTDRTIRAAVFIQARHLATLSNAGKVVVWQLPDLQPVWTATVAWAERMTMTPGRRHLIVAARGRMWFLDPPTGKTNGILEYPGALQNIIFNREATRLAGMAAILTEFDLRTGEALSDTPLATTGFVPEYLDDEHLLFDKSGDTMVFDAARKMIVWRIEMTNGRRLGTSPDGQPWTLVSSQRRNYLAPLSLPTAKLYAFVDSKIPKRPQPIFGPGAVISLDTQGVSAAIADRLRQHLTGKNMRIADGQTVRVVASVKQGASRTVDFGQNPTQTDLSVEVSGTVCQLSIVDGQRAVWQREFYLAPQGFAPVEFVPRDVNAAEFLQRRGDAAKASGVADFFRSVRLPEVLMRQPTDGEGKPGLGKNGLVLDQLIKVPSG